MTLKLKLGLFLIYFTSISLFTGHALNAMEDGSQNNDLIQDIPISALSTSVSGLQTPAIRTTTPGTPLPIIKPKCEQPKCEQCNKECKTKGVLYQHNRKKHQNIKYSCPLCDKSYTARASLDRHILKHTGEQPYKCDICPYATEIKANLLRHLRKHTKEKAYACDQCEFTFSRGDHLKNHKNRKHPIN